MPRVIISSGHTSANPGVTYNGLQEYELARKIAKYALKYIRVNGLISLSVPPNLELAQRVDWINKTGYMRETNDLAIEIHINDGGGSGVEGWFEGDGGNPSQGIANIVLAAVAQETGLPNLGAKSEFQHPMGSIAFVHEVKPHGVIIECGFIDGPQDSQFLKDEKNLDACGRGIAKGILNFYGLDYREVQQPGPAQQMSAPAQSFSPGATVPEPPQQPQTTGFAMGNQINVAQAAPVKTPTLNSQTDQYDEEYDDYDDDTTDLKWDSPAVKPSPSPTPTVAANPAPATSAASLNNFAVANPPAYQPPKTPAYPGVSSGAYTPPAAPGYPPSNGAFPTREERKEMIIRNYLKILGREPNQNDLNYFLNIGIREEELIKKMVDSQEHADLVKARQEVTTMKEQFTNTQEELSRLRASTQDQEKILDQLQQSISQKNAALTSLQYELKELQQKQHSLPQATKKSNSKPKYKGTFKDKLFKAISDLME